MKNFKFLSYCLVAISLLYGSLETAFFGRNFFPKSAEELLADGIFLISLNISMIAVMLSHQKDK